MQLSPTNLRYEKKFVAEGFSLAEVVGRVRRHPAAFREVFPPRVVNNIYLDSPTRRDYHAHINGAPDRTKTRVRWYGPQPDSFACPVLERKVKRGMVSGKEAYPLHQTPAGEGCLGSRLQATLLDAALPPPLTSVLRHLEPALFNRYYRYYFLSRDGNFRLTVDCCLEFAAVPTAHRPVMRLSTPVKSLILELKFAPDAAQNIDLITNALPFRVARFSKYVAGIERM